MNVFFVTVLLAINQPVPAPTEVWPQWRGPTADSVAPGKNLPMKWSKTENIAWKTALSGWGTSTPAIWEDAIFVTTQVNDRQLLVLRLDTKSGKIVWQREVGEGEPRRQGPVGVGRFHDEHNMASPSPVTDGKHVWVHFGNGDLACYDFAGKKIWAANLAKDYGPYRYALSAAGMFVGYEVLGGFYRAFHGKSAREARAGAADYFRAYVHMIRPIVGATGPMPKGTINDHAVMVCFGSSGRPFAINVSVRAGDQVHGVLLPWYDNGESAATYVDFLRNENEILNARSRTLNSKSSQWEGSETPIERRTADGASPLPNAISPTRNSKA